MPDKSTSTIFKYFLLLFGVSFLLVGKLLWPFASILIISMLLVSIFRPIYKFLVRYMSDHFASMLTCGLIILLVFVPLSYFVMALSKEGIAYFQFIKGINFAVKTQELIQGSTIFARIQTLLDGYGISFDTNDLINNLASFAQMLGLFFYNKASAWAANIFNFFIDFSLMILVIFFLMIDYDRLVKFVMEVSPLPEEQENQLIDKFQKIAQAIMLGNGICGLIQGFLGGLLFAYFQLGSPILWGGIMAVMAFLPIVGIGIILLPTALIFLLKGSIGKAIFTAIFYFVLSMSIEYLLKPKLVGRQVKMHTLVVFLSIIGGLSTFGVLGIIYGPLIITAFLTLADIYLKNYASEVKGAGYVEGLGVRGEGEKIDSSIVDG
jgi:predicted PurR-regulated permease PerM